MAKNKTEFSKFDRQNLALIRVDIQKALNEVALKNGLAEIRLGPISFTECDFTTKLSAKTNDRTNSVANKYFEIMFGKPLLGVSFKYNNQLYTIKDFKTRARKFPIVCSVEGKLGEVSFAESLIKDILKIK